MRSEILHKHPFASLRVLVVWLPMLPGDGRATTDNRLLGDKRVINFWDGRRLAGSWFAEHVDHSPEISWDEYFLYGKDARWEAAPAPLLSQGGTVIGSSDQLATAITPLLK